MLGTVICASSVAAYSPVDHDDPVDEGWSTDRARSELDWTPRHNGAEALRAMLLGAGQRAGSDLPPLRP